MKNRIFWIVLIIALSAQYILANQGGNDTFGHMWTDNKGTVTIDYNWIDIKSTANQIFSASYDDQAPVGIELPFAFNFYGVAHDSIFVSPNGWLSFKNPNGDSYPTNDTLPSASAPDSVIAPYWDDLSGDSRADDGIYYAVVGTAPNRKIVVQWESVTFNLGFTVTLIFEAVLYEHSNLILFQYKTVDSDLNGGGEATVGIGADASDGLTYYYGTGTGLGPITSNMAILFHNKRLASSANAQITPTSAAAGSYTTFQYRIYDIDLTGAAGLGKLDRFAIKNPFASVPAVNSIYINGASAYIQNSQSTPDDPGYATWYYDSNTDSLIVRTSHFDVIDSLRIVFGQSLPSDLSENNTYPSTIDAVLDSSARTATSDAGYAVAVVGGPVAYYSLTPTGDQSIQAGGSISYTVTARDQYGNGVLNSDDIIVSTPGSSTATVSPSTTLNFSNDSTLTFTVSDTIAGSFTVHVEKSTDSDVNGESGLVTVSAAAADHLTKLSSEASITVGTDRLLQVRLEDTYGNDLANANVTFTRVRGSGTFSNGLSSITVTTDDNGVAQATYTASTELWYVSDSIDVVSGSVSTQYVLPLQAGQVSYYTLSPSGNQTITAGGSISYTATARDQYGNGVVNSDAVTVSTPGSSTATVSPSSSLSFSNDSTLSFTVSDTISGQFAVHVEKADNSDINGESGIITVDATALSYVIIRSEANNGGTEVGAVNMTTDEATTLYAAGYDQYGNYVGDTDVTWSSTGTLESVNATGSKYTFSPSLAGVSGTIVATPSGGGTADETGTITVSVGQLAEIRIQTSAAANGAIPGDTTLTADETLTLYSVGYDADGNYIGSENADWTLNDLSGSLSPDNPTSSVTFTPLHTGSGSITATSSSNSNLSDRTGSITVNAGAITYVIIRDEANGGGQEIGDLTMTAGQSLTLYAAGYDSKDNFSGNADVDWSTTGTLSGLSADNTNTYVVTLSPTEPGSGTVQTSNGNGWTDDQTGTITVQEASLARIEIRTAANGGGIALGDSSATAGDAWTLYAAGYDLYGNYLGDVTVHWGVSGDSIGYFASSDSASSNTFHFTRANSGQFVITKNTLSDASGIIKNNPSAPDTMLYVSSNNFTGAAGSKISDSLAVKVLDAFDNVVPGVTVNWEAQDPTANLSPTTDLTDNQGISRSKWKLRNTIGKDSAYAIVPSIPDSLKFTANVLESQANSLQRWVDASNDSARTGTVKTQLANPLVLQVLDSLGNPVSDVPITFAVLSYPDGGGDFTFSPDASEKTDETGRVSVDFIPGSKAGTYTITGYNDNLINSGSIFFSVTAQPAAADHLTLITENNQQDTVATTYGDSVRVKVEDAYGNAVSGVTVNWTPTGTGSVSPASSVSNGNGLVATQWTLRQQAGQDTLHISSTGLTSIQALATLVADAPALVTADSGNYRAAVAGNGQLIRAKVTDRYGNVVSNQKVQFQPLDADAYVSEYEVNTGLDGLAATTYTGPEDADSSQVRAYIANVDTATFTLYAIRYQSGSLSPSLVDLNDTVSFYITVKNPSSDAIPLNLSASTLSFANEQFTTTLDSPATLAPGLNRLKYASAVIPNSIDAGNYTPKLYFAGSGTYQNMKGTTYTDDGELSVQPIRILSVTVPAPKEVPRGTDKENIRLKVRNSGNYTVNVDSVYLKFTPDYNFTQQRTSGPTTIAPGTDAIFEFTVSVPQSAQQDTVTVDGQIFATSQTSGDAIQDGAADQTDYFVVTQQANLDYVSFTPQVVSENQNTQFTFQVQNNGAYDVILDKDSTRLVFGSQTFYLTENQTAAANSVSTLDFAAQDITLSAANSPYAGTLYVYGTENTQPVRDTLYTASAGDSLTVQTIAQLSLTSVVLNDTLTTQGAENDTLTVTVQNSGQAAAVISSADSVIIQYASEYTFTPLQSFPYQIDGQSSATLRYLIKTAADAPLGYDTMRVEIGYQDANSETNYHLADPQKYDSWQVLGPGELQILSVNTNYDSVSTGQDSILVWMRVRNAGQNSVQLDSVQLSFSNGSYLASTIKRTVSKTLTVGQSDTVQFHVALQTNSATGAASINGKAYGHDTFTQELVQDTDADTTDSWLIVSAVSLAADENEPQQISSGQYIEPWVILHNSGEATLNFDRNNTILFIDGQPSFYRKLVRPAAIAGGVTDTLFFEADEASGPSGQYDVDLQIKGWENGSFFADTLAMPNQLTIQDGAVLTIDSVVAEATSISQGTDTSAVVVVSNNGEATLILDTLYLSAYPQYTSITPQLPAQISGHTQERFTIRFTVPADDPTGSKTLDAVARGRDENLWNGGIDSTLKDDGATVPDQWTVYTPANVSITSVTSPDTVVHQGDIDIPVHVTLHNDGGATARIDNVTMQKKIGLYAFHYPDFAFELAGNSDTTITVMTDVKSNSATGNDTLSATVNFTDTFSGTSSEGSSSSDWKWRIIGREPIIQIISVTTEPEKVSLGQTGITVNVRVKNTGDRAADITALSLQFSNNGSSAYTQGTISPALGTIQPGVEVTYVVPLDVEQNANVGPDTMWAALNVHEAETGLSYSVEDNTINDSWEVQQRPDIVIDKVEITPSVASTGQENLTAKVYVNNTQGNYRADAQINDVVLLMRKGGISSNDQFVITRKSTPSLPIVLQNGKTLVFEFDVDVRTTAEWGTYDAYARVESEDVNDGTVTQTLTVTTPGTLQVQTVANLVVDTLWVVPDTVSEQQDHARLYVKYSNTGQAAVQVNSTGLQFDQPNLDFNPMLISESTPFTLAGGADDTLVYALEMPDINVDTLTVHVDATVSGNDVNSDQETTAQSGQPGRFFLESAASLEWMSTEPTSWSVDTLAVQFKSVVLNHGQATVLLDTSQTTMQIRYVNSSTVAHAVKLDASSPKVIASQPDSTQLVFHEEVLPIAAGEYELFLHLVGTTNDSVFSEDLYAGQFVFGDSIIAIKSIQIQTDDHVLQGADSIVVYMKVSNSEGPKTITPDLTKLIFKGPNKSDDRDAFVLNMQRLDTLTILKNEENNLLKFQFDITDNFPAGDYTEIYGQIGLDDGDIVKVSNTFDKLYVQTSGNALYVEDTFAPDSVVPQEKVKFTLALNDTGSADITLDAQKTYLLIENSPVDTIKLSAEYTISGKDTASVLFNEIELPADLNPGTYDVQLHVYGTTLGGAVFEQITNLSQGLIVLKAGEVHIARVNAEAQKVRQGQTNVPISFRLHNDGQSTVYISKVEYLFRKTASQQDVSDDWIWLSGTAEDTTIAGQDSLEYTAYFNVDSEADTGMVMPLLRVTYYDELRPYLTETSDSIEVKDSLRVIRPSHIRIDSLVLTQSAATPNAPYVNFGQTAPLKILVSNIGQDTIAQAQIRLYLNGSALADEISFTNIAPAPDSQQVAYYNWQADQLDQVDFKAVVATAKDAIGRDVTVDQATDNVETIIVQQPSQIWPDVRITEPEGALDSVVTLGQIFTVQTIVEHQGNSPYGPGVLTLRLPDNYRFADGDDDSLRTFDRENSTVQWRVQPVSVTQGDDFDSLLVTFREVPVDSNQAPQKVTVVKSNVYLPVKVENKGVVELTVTIVSPQGAVDSTVSTGQEFVVQSAFEFLGPVQPTGKKARIILPQGFSVKDSSQVNLEDGLTVDPVLWHVVAPSTATTQPVNIYVEIEVRDANSGQVMTVRSAPLPVQVQTAPQIVLRSTVAEPDGAKDFVVSTGQTVVLKTVVENTGQAAFDHSGILRLTADGGILFKHNRANQQANSPVNVIEGVEATTYSDTLIIPEKAGTGTIRIQMLASEYPKDVNSGETVTVSRDSIGLVFHIVERADLVLHFGDMGALNDTLFRSTDQSFTITAVVENHGTAGVENGVWVRLDTTQSHLILQSGDSLVHKVQPGASTAWQVKAPAQDYTGHMKISVDPDHPALDENTGESAFSSAQVAADTLQLAFKKVQNILVSSAFVQNGKDTLTVSTDQEPIVILSRLVFHELLDGEKKVTLTLPEGFASLDTSLVQNVNNQAAEIRWHVRAPAQAASWQTMKISVTARSQSIPGLAPITIDDSVRIQVVPKAQLSLLAKIVAPAGAIDDSVSPGQLFKLMALVNNKPDAAPTTGTGTVALRLGEQFSIVDASGQPQPQDSVKAFTPGSPVYWWVRVADAAAAPAVVRSLQARSNRLQSKILVAGRVETETQLAANDLLVKVKTTPADIHTQQPAFIQNDEARKTIYIGPKAQITITQAVSDTVSTGQIYPLTVRAQLSSNVINAFARFTPASENLGSAPQPIPLNAQGQAIWNVRIPDDYSGDGTETVQIVVQGTDENSGQTIRDEKTVQLTVQQKAQLALSDFTITPLTVANSGLLSEGQDVQLSVKPVYAPKKNGLKYADLEGSGTVVLDSTLIKKLGFSLLDNQNLARSFSDTGQVLVWKLKAPFKELTANLQLSFDQMPLDANSGLPATADKTLGQVSFPVRVRQKTITIKAQPFSVDTSLTKGQSNVPIISFSVSNAEFDDPLHVSGVQIGFYATGETPDEQNLLTPKALALMFQSLQVMDFADFQAAKKKGLAKKALAYASLDITDTTANPVFIPFDQVADIEAHQEKQLIVVAQLRDNVVNRVFRASLTQVQVYDFDPQKPLGTVDEYGQKLQESDQLTSKAFTLVSSDPKEAFGNYPNPFGRQYSFTNIAFLLEHDSDVDIRIFTLNGELVWSKKLTGLRRGFYDRLVKWDGTNDQGQRVLNGVYLGTIDIRPLDGSPSQRYITKIAYIK